MIEKSVQNYQKLAELRPDKGIASKTSAETCLWKESNRTCYWAEPNSINVQRNESLVARVRYGAFSLFCQVSFTSS
jgi:hypothetical protein